MAFTRVRVLRCNHPGIGKSPKFTHTCYKRKKREEAYREEDSTHHKRATHHKTKTRSRVLGED